MAARNGAGHVFGLASTIDYRKTAREPRRADGAPRPCLRCGLPFRPTRRRWYTCGPCFIVNSHDGELPVQLHRFRRTTAAP